MFGKNKKEFGAAVAREKMKEVQNKYVDSSLGYIFSAINRYIEFGSDHALLVKDELIGWSDPVVAKTILQKLKELGYETEDSTSIDGKECLRIKW